MVDPETHLNIKKCWSVSFKTLNLGAHKKRERAQLTTEKDLMWKL